ncbi:type II toxin-antitoxin system VapC family toxin [Candidatus Woesearchaeota archaeon]|nr:type II toxin-antitoxin system VapC family toxin [Candidatus Woesearchaeota archaeon]
MEEDFYLDTSIWLDFYEKREENGELAFKLILKIINQNLKVAYSDLHIKEFKNLGYTQNEINSILSIVKPNNIKHIHIYREQKEEAKKTARQRNVPEGDILHAILCRDNNLQLISRDLDFEKLKDIANHRNN